MEKISREKIRKKLGEKIRQKSEENQSRKIMGKRSWKKPGKIC